MHSGLQSFNRSIVVFALVVLSASCRNAVWATVGNTAVVYDNFGPNNSVEPYGTVVGTGPIGNWSISAIAVVPAYSGPLAKLTLGAELSGYPFSHQQNDFLVTLRNDYQNSPADQLWDGDFVNQLSGVPAVVLDNLNGPWLDAGQKYWFVVSTPPNDNSTFHFWEVGFGPPTDSVASFSNSSFPNWRVANNVSGYAIRVEVLPEPGALCLAIGCCGILIRRSRRSDS